jgi:HSP20 family protein
MLNLKKINIMSIIRYNPNDFAPTSFSALVDRLFNDSITRSGGSAFVPKTDVIETTTAFEVHLAVPGLNKEDFTLEVNDNSLTISGERKFQNEKKEKNYHAIETHFGSFSRSFTLPENVDATKISARYNNGILEVSIPKTKRKF